MVVIVVVDMAMRFAPAAWRRLDLMVQALTPLARAGVPGGRMSTPAPFVHAYGRSCAAVCVSGFVLYPGNRFAHRRAEAEGSLRRDRRESQPRPIWRG